MGKHLLVINFTMDENHAALSHQREVVFKLSQYFEKVSVVTGSSSNTSTPSNVSIHEINWRERHPIRNAANLIFIFWRILLFNRPTAVFSHMVPIHSAITAPISKFLRIRHVLWYAHAATPISLRIASFFVDKILSSTDGSCNLNSRKVTFIGQGVDSKVFCFQERNLLRIHRVLYVGRMDPSKNISSIISAVKVAKSQKPELEITFVGGPVESNQIPICDWITSNGPVPRSKLPKLYASADVFIHAFQGSLDKVLVEAVLSGLPVVTANNEFKRCFKIFGTNTDSIEIQLKNLLAMPPVEITTIINKNYKIAIENHELNGWIRRLVNSLN